MESRVIQLTSAAHKYGNLNIRPCGRDFFPPDVFGGSAKANPGTQITIKAEGLPNPINTDIPTDSTTGRPRWLFRRRGWVRKFVTIHNLNTGDTIIINRIAPRNYLVIPEKIESDLVKLEKAARIVGKTPHNIRDYIQRGRINKYDPFGNRISKARNGQLRVSLKELRDFLDMLEQDRKKHHRSGLHKELGFYGLPEYERTKHVHRLHPYLGKFIPQLVEWFLAEYFKEDDVILDPFMGSGTTLVQGNEMKMHTIGVEISAFNCLIAKVKTKKFNIKKAKQEILEAERRLSSFSTRLCAQDDEQLSLFPEERMEKLKASLMAEVKSEYLKTWFAKRTLYEMMYYRRLIKAFEYQDLLKILLSRAVRSARLIPHYDLARPKAPIEAGKEYWCKKHRRMCKPIEQLLVKIHNYSMDTVRRLETFDKLRSDKSVTVIQGDSQKVNLAKELKKTPISGRKIDGIFTSPPYVGQIDYHDQHIYAYELFGFPRNDKLEIGPQRAGKSKQAQGTYIEGISAVFRNVKKYLKDDAKIFIVANDRLKLYPEIAERSGLKIIEEFHRAVTKRTEQGDNPYQETIFWMKKH
ncbi:MAG: site-specific DNA-methyltransferase [Deltaproteobacteria bacterium]|nr:site-specific DNA-methyltransferase [Deltaproteobacteria bacterium]